MYSTSSEHTRVPWAAHSYNVAFSDEIGHFEYCDAITGEGGDCTANSESTLDGDDSGCFSAAFSTFVPITGCIASDSDFDGVPYQKVWPGTDPNRGQDTKYHPGPVTFTSPLFNGTQNYSRVAFEADLPRIEGTDSGGICNRSHGADCVNSPPGSNFYPIYSTGTSTQNPSANGHCVWQLGGPYIKGTTNTFGGNSAAEFGPLLFSFYPVRTLRFGGGRTTSATSSTPIRARPNSRGLIDSRRGRPRGASPLPWPGQCPRAIPSTAPRASSRCSSANGSESRRRTRGRRARVADGWTAASSSASRPSARTCS